MEEYNLTNRIEDFTVHGHLAGIITDSLVHYLSLYLSGVACAAVSLLGVITNFINIVVFFRQGVKDSTTISFLSLSVTDLGVSLTTFLFGLSYICRETGYLIEIVDWDSVTYVLFGWPRVLFLDISMLTTVFISLERCLGVTMPLTIKHVITLSRTKKITFLIYVFIAICYIPIFSTHGLIWQTNNATNTSTLTLWLGSARPQAEIFCNTFNNIVLPTCSYVTVVVCTYSMITKLKQSSEFRKKATRDTNIAEKTRVKSKEERDVESHPRGGENLTAKDRRVVKLVVIVATVFIVCGLPQVVLVYARRLIPDLNVNKRFGNLHLTLFSIVYFFGGISASVNMFIYLNASSKYRSAFSEIFSRIHV